MMNELTKLLLSEESKWKLSESGVWSADTQASFDYSDGDAGEQYLRQAIQSATDRSHGSLEIESSIFDWVSEYHLSGERANIYRFLNLEEVKYGLELGAGCGAITRYLGEQGMVVDAVEGNIRRAEITRLRCQEQDNVNVVHCNFNELEFPRSVYDAVFFNGVLEYAGKFLPGYNDKEALVEILNRALTTLKPGGVACIAIENRMGLKYWLGANEDHYGQPFLGLYGYPAGKGIRTYDHNEWLAILQDLPGQLAHRFIYPFPDYKMAKSILSDNYVSNNQFAHSNLYRILSSDNGKPLTTEFNEFLLWEAIHNSGQLEQYANSFFIIISSKQEKLDEICCSDFMHFSGRGRKPEFRTITRKKMGKATVTKRQVLPHKKQKSEILKQDLVDTQYEIGSLLVSHWIHAAIDDDFRVFETCIKEYFKYLVSYWNENEDASDGVDLLPFNLVVDEKGNYLPIDKEWKMAEGSTPEFVLFRALLWFPVSNETILKKVIQQNKLSTRYDFIEYGFNVVSLSLKRDLDNFIDQEETFQEQTNNQVRANPVKAMLVEPLMASTLLFGANVFPAQLYWAEGKEAWSEDKSVLISAREGSETQSLIFNVPHVKKGVCRFRLDPCNRAGFFRIYSVTIFGYDAIDQDNEEILLFELTSSKELAKFTELNNVLYCHNGLGETFFSTGEDPSFSFDLANKLANIKDYKIERIVVEMDWPKSADYLVVMEKVGKQLLENSATILENEKTIFELQEISRNQAESLKFMQETHLWRTRIWVRNNLYYRVLDGKSLLKKSINIISNEGVRQFLRKARRALSSNSAAVTLGFLGSDYGLWVKKHSLSEFDVKIIRQEIEAFRYKPLISIIVPVYDVDQQWLELAIDSIRVQLYENWELCLCDDCSPSPHVQEVLKRYAHMDERIKILIKPKNEGIAITSNAALSLATGDFVGLLDHDDELSINALYENVKIINEHPEVGVIYSDEDKMDMQGNRVDPFFKPDYSPELICSQNYICHFTVIKKRIIDEIGGFSEGFDGSQDHDLILRAIEKSERVYHIPKILYHWRKIPGSTAAIYDSKSYAWEAGRKAVDGSLKRQGIKGKVSFAKYKGSYRVTKDIIGNPLISIIIPFKDKAKLLTTCVKSIIKKSNYTNFEIIGIDNSSEEQKTFQTIEALLKYDKRISFVQYSKPFNFASICNLGVEKSKGDFVLLLNNDTEVISPEWLEMLLEHAQQPGVGAVGGKLYYPDDTIQHAGVVIGMTGVAGHPHRKFHRDDVGYYARPHIISNVSAVTGACLMISKTVYRQLGGMDGEKFGVAYNDIDLCMKALKSGYRNVFTPYCELYHYESQSRGYEDTPEKVQRLEMETKRFNEKWAHFFKNGDPCYNPNLSLKNERFTIQV